MSSQPPQELRFLHCGDVHLGAGRQVHPERYADLFRVFQEVLVAAREPGIDALLISGDLFDTKEPDVETLAHAIGVMRALKSDRPDLPVLAIEGNHDMRKQARGAFRNEQGVLDVLEQAGLLTLLRPERTDEGTLNFSGAFHDLPGKVTVLGLGYWRENPEERFREAMEWARTQRPDGRVVVLAHMMIAHPGSDLYHGSAYLDDLLPVPDNVVYVGLGHGHSRVDASDSRHGGVFYSPGSLEFVHARNTRKSPDTRGFFDVQLAASGAVATHRPTHDKRPFVHRHITLTPESAPDLDAVVRLVCKAIRAHLQESERKPILSVSLSGRIGFPAAGFRSSVIELALRQTFDAMQVFVRREQLTNAQGEAIDVDVRDGYAEALRGVLAELLSEHADAIGLPDAGKALIPALHMALEEDQNCEDALDAVEDLLAKHRGDIAAVPEVDVDLTGAPAESGPLAAFIAEHLGEGPVRVRLCGAPPLDEDGLPVLLELEALQEQLSGENGRLVSLFVDSALYAAQALEGA